jgi:8-oxo-dGTP diphosphatase
VHGCRRGPLLDAPWACTVRRVDPLSSGSERLASAVVTARALHPVDVLLLFADAERLLLALREGTGYADGQWNLGQDGAGRGRTQRGDPRGARRDRHVFGRDEPRMVATVHHRNTAGLGRVGLVFTVAYDPARHGVPVNAEPYKCAKIAWTAADLLPSNTYPYSVACVRAFRDGEQFALSGWA